jgi:arsenate reductase (thioredoxin)
MTVTKPVDEPTMAKNILILCTGNSCRSIIAEAIINAKAGGRYQAFSAGSKPSGRVNPHALALLKEKGLATSGLRSKSWDEFSGPYAPPLDYVITVCGNAAGETCPVWIGAPVSGHWGIADPAEATGSETEIHAAFAETFRLLELRVDAFLALKTETMDNAEIRAALRKIGDIEGAA